MFRGVHSGKCGRCSRRAGRPEQTELPADGLLSQNWRSPSLAAVSLFTLKRLEPESKRMAIHLNVRVTSNTPANPSSYHARSRGLPFVPAAGACRTARAAGRL